MSKYTISGGRIRALKKSVITNKLKSLKECNLPYKDSSGSRKYIYLSSKKNGTIYDTLKDSSKYIGNDDLFMEIYGTRLQDALKARYLVKKVPCI